MVDAFLGEGFVDTVIEGYQQGHINAAILIKFISRVATTAPTGIKYSDVLVLLSTEKLKLAFHIPNRPCSAQSHIVVYMMT